MRGSAHVRARAGNLDLVLCGCCQMDLKDEPPDPNHIALVLGLSQPDSHADSHNESDLDSQLFESDGLLLDPEPLDGGGKSSKQRGKHELEAVKLLPHDLERGALAPPSLFIVMNTE